jgi:hypothetical protein
MAQPLTARRLAMWRKYFSYLYISVRHTAATRETLCANTPRSQHSRVLTRKATLEYFVCGGLQKVFFGLFFFTFFIAKT